jgi:hypothetical protein
MHTLKSWLSLPHETRVKALASSPVGEVAESYDFGGLAKNEAIALLEREKSLWATDNVEELRGLGAPPTKDSLLGSYRDLDRSEALLELIDNSIDAWRSRRARYPEHSAKELIIQIEVDKETRRLTYEDNAGGASRDRLVNLVLPGYSDTEPLSPTIGSYRTGGKKAVFRLATAARIDTRYHDPGGATDDALTIHLDEAWMNDPGRYEFLHSPMKDKSKLELGHTRFVLDLRDEPLGGPFWAESPDLTGKIASDIRRTYSLLLLRHPIKIYFMDRAKHLTPDEALFLFSGTYLPRKLDIRPQRVTFKTALPHQGVLRTFEIEIVLGCRPTTGAVGYRGIDLYGNDRLFVLNDHHLAPDLLPVTGGRANLVRGFINVKGPNVFIPWDTHKRHLNLDRDVIGLIRKNKLIHQLLENWRHAYNDISGREVTKIISTPHSPAIDGKKRDLALPHDSTVELDASRKRGAGLPAEVFAPLLPPAKRSKGDIKLSIALSEDDARLLGSHYKVDGLPSAHGFTSELAHSVKEDVLKRAKRK